MRRHSIEDARKRLSELIDCALLGERVVITRWGRPVAELQPISSAPARPVSAADVDWLATHRVGKAEPTEVAGMLVSRMRDEDDV